MGSATSVAVEPVRWRPAANPWLIAVTVSLAAFMEVLDTSIANVALPHIAGNLGASNEQSTWVLTSYLVANAIVLPITGWLVGIFGRKRFFMTCMAVFTVSSLLCGIAPSLGSLLLFRVFQGAGGGGLQPMAQAILADTFPPDKRGLAFSIYGITAVCAPAIGPTLGGWLTDTTSWRWIFLINLPVGILALFLVLRLVEDPPHVVRRKVSEIKLDYVGFSFLALGVGALQIMLDKGQEDDWFGSHFILTLAIIAVVCLTALILYEWWHDDPIVDVRLFKNSNFAAANMMMFMVGAVSFATTVLMPLFLQTLMGYTAESAGMVLSVAAVLLLIELPIVGRLIGRFQLRYLIAFGWITLAIGMYISARKIDLLISFSAATWLRIGQYLPLGFVFVPATTAAYIGIREDKSNAVAGLVNFTRNIGASVGTSIVTTMIVRRSQYHQSVLAAHTSPANARFRDAIGGLAQQLANAGVGLHDARQQALGRLYAEVQLQASALAYIDTFWVLGIAAVVMVALSFVLRKNNPREGRGSVSVH
ncbi:MAG TPA: DHA2 family efflux MFS transporter permease subunit [Candidatus Sulfotelmatobacter sp.]|jgi:DHA2 family multidrug resistance protein|nr:DHA2 family efflux MFS transporter permease subunit [Candidatus Sulfotelmatobacter sp.]